MIVLNDNVSSIPGNKGVFYDDSKLVHIESIGTEINDEPFDKLYVVKSTTGTYLPFYLLWDGEELVSTKTTFEDAKRNQQYAHDIASSTPGNRDAEKEARKWFKKKTSRL